MPHATPVSATYLILAALALTGCGDGAGPAPIAAAATPAQDARPWESVPPESIYGATAVDNVRTVPVELDLLKIPRAWDGMKIAAISDLQIGLWSRNEQVAAAAIQRAVSTNADLIVLLGDYAARAEDLAALARVLVPLQGKHVLAVLGDRDIASDSLAADIGRVLNEAGIQVLKNRAVPFVYNGDTASIAGVDPELATGNSADQAWILSQLGGADPALLLTHVPQLAAREPNGRFPAILAGNTFCGRVAMPGTPRLASLTSQALPGAIVPGEPQLFRLGGSVLFVTCGVGYGFVPTRFGTPPEVALITLHRVSSPAVEATPDAGSLDTLLDSIEQQAMPPDSANQPVPD